MKNLERRNTWTAICSTTVMALIAGAPTGASAETWELLSLTNIPKCGTFFGIQDTAPYPFLPHPEWQFPVYRVTTKDSTNYVYDDRSVDYKLWNSWKASQTGLIVSLEAGEPLESSSSAARGAGELWIEMLGWGNDLATLALHNVHSNSYGQILSRTNIEEQAWRLGPILPNGIGTNLLVFEHAPTFGLSRQFYRGVEGFPVASVETDRYFYEAAEPTAPGNPPAGIGIFNVNLSDTLETNLTVFFQICGSAANGVDYTNLAGSIVIAAGELSARLFIHPLYDMLLEFDESVRVSLILTNSYVVDPDRGSAIIWIKDNLTTNVFATVVSNLNHPVGMDYHQPSNSLVASVNWDQGVPNNFARIYTNAGLVLVTNWSGIAGEPDEIKVATAKQTVSGFTNGDLFFGSNARIGWLSADATRSNLTWCVLTNDFVVNAQHLRGGLYVDQSGMFSNHLIAVTSDSDPSPSLKGVWEVNGQGGPNLLTLIRTDHLEGLVTLTNDANRWGPWAGKILTGDESQGTVYSVATNGDVQSFALGINPEDFDLIPANQDLYCLNFHDGEPSQLLKLSRQWLTNFVGDLLITQAGEFNDGARLFITRWDGTNIESRRLTLPSGFGGHFEHVTFSPFNLPAQTP